MKTTVTYGVIKNLEVELPDPITPASLVSAFAKAYVEYTCGQGLVSDDVLVSSIGAAHVKHAMLGGVRNRCRTESDYEAFQTATDRYWESSVLQARYGDRDGMVAYWVRNGADESRAVELADKLYA